MRSSWAGATGLTQFLPSEYYKHGVDFDGDGRVDIWNSVPDALASAAQQLVNKGWQPGVRWAYEVQRARQCRLHDGRARGDETDRRVAARRLRAGARTKAQRRGAGAAGLAAAAGGHLRSGVPDHEELLRHQGIQFLRSRMCCSSAISADRMLSPQPFATPWSASTQLRTADVEAMQRHLTRIGLYKDKLDGKAGMQTRAALGAYQKSAGLKVDCWPSEAVLRAIGAAR